MTSASAAGRDLDLERTAERESPSALRLAFAGRTDDGIGRTRNEDSLLLLPESGLAVVADGMGGRPCGRLASELAVTTVGEYFRDVAPFDVVLPGAVDPELTLDQHRLVTAIRRANDRLFEQGPELPGRAGTMATTLVAGLLSFGGQLLTIGHVGDSRCYRLRDGRAVQLTRDHSLAIELAGRAPMFAEQVYRHVPRKVLTRALGLERHVQVDLFSDATTQGDIYLLCTDGLWSCVSPLEMLETVSSTSDLDEAAARFVARARDQGGADNITVALIRVEHASPSRPSGVVPRSDPIEELAAEDVVEVDLAWGE